MKNWNEPISALGSVCGATIKPYHVALLGVGLCFIVRKVPLLLERRRHAELCRLRRLELEQELAKIPNLDRVRYFLCSHGQIRCFSINSHRPILSDRMCYT